MKKMAKIINVLWYGQIDAIFQHKVHGVGIFTWESHKDSENLVDNYLNTGHAEHSCGINKHLECQKKRVPNRTWKNISVISAVLYVYTSRETLRNWT